MKSRKAIKISLIALASLALFILLVFLFWLGPTVKLIAQGVGSKALGTPLTIGKLSINPRNGMLHLSDFAIANPDQFGRSNAVSLASLDVSIDMGSLFGSTVVVHQVSINSPHFIYEQGSATDNITQFIRNVQEFAGFDASTPSEEPPEKTADSEKPPKVVLVESLSVNDVQVHLANTDDPGLDMAAGFEHLDLSMTNGLVRLHGFHVGNPGRLETPNLFHLDQLAIDLDPGTIHSTNVVIDAVRVTRPHAFIEYNAETDTIGEFVKIANSLIARIPTNIVSTSDSPVVHMEQAEPSPAELPSATATLRKVAVEDLRLNVVNNEEPQHNVFFGFDVLDADLDAGMLDLKYLHLTNPERLSTPDLFSLESIAVEFTPQPLASDVVAIEDVKVRKPHLHLELNEESNTVGEFLAIIKGFADRAPRYVLAEIPMPPAANPQQAIQDAPRQPALEMGNILIDDIRLQLLDTTPTNTANHKARTIAGIGAITFDGANGKAQVLDVTVPNTPGFTASNIFHLANIDVAIDPETLASDQVVIDNIFVNAPEINLEQTEDSGNVSELQATLLRFTPQPNQLPAVEPSTKTVEEAKNPAPVAIADRPVVLRGLMVTNFAINLKLPVSTNASAGGIQGAMGKLNPMDALSLQKLNPLGGNTTNEVETIDPNAPIRLVAFDSLSAEPLAGLIQVNNLRISNPPGFTKNDLVSIERFKFDIDPDTIQSDVMVIEDIEIARPKVRYERQILVDNIKALQLEVERAINRREHQAHPEQTAQPEKVNAAAQTQKVVINRLAIPNGMVQAKLSALPAIPVPLPNIELVDLGKEKGGLGIAEAGSMVFNTFYDSIVGAVGSATGFAGDALKNIGSLTFGTVEDAATGTRKKVKDAVESIKDRDWFRRGAGGRRHPLK